MGQRVPLMYGELADWFPLITAPEEYVEEAEEYRQLLAGACDDQANTLLELGSGGGNNAFHYKRHFRATLVDLSPRMLEVSRRLNPECEHVAGDMRSVRLGRTFDTVFVHDAVMYLTSVADLLACMETATAHLRPGGAALFVPDCVAETLVPGIECGGHDAPDGSRGVRYLEWVRDADPADTTFEVDYAYLLREGSRVRTAHDRHERGVFPRATWRQHLERAGLQGVSEPGPAKFLARKPR
jgi:SAM-dependent methyltransferase